MDAIDFIPRIEEAGFAVALSGGNLAISPASDLNDRQRDFIRSHKDELVAALQSRETVTTRPTEYLDAARCNVVADELPDRLRVAASRVCREIHNDTDAQVLEMLEDLRHYPQADWPKLTEHFEQQLPAPPEQGFQRFNVTMAGYEFHIDIPDDAAEAYQRSLPMEPPTRTVHRCADCNHANVISGIAHCSAGIDSLLPTSGYWATDWHPCSKFKER